MFCTNVFSKTSLKLKNPRTHPTLVGKYPASKNLYGRVDFFLSEKRLIDSDKLSQSVESPILSTTCRITLKEFSIEDRRQKLLQRQSAIFTEKLNGRTVGRIESLLFIVGCFSIRAMIRSICHGTVSGITAPKSRKKRAEMKPNSTDRFLDCSKY